MKKVIKLLALSLFLVFALQGTVFASELPLVNKGKENSAKVECNHCKTAKHYSRAASRILENKYGFKQEDIEKAKASGKTFFDLAKSKGMNEADLKAAIIAPKLKAIEEATNTGELSKEKAEELKSKIKENMEKWNGSIENFKGHKDNNKNNKENEQAS